jgi:hypothetical protein
MRRHGFDFENPRALHARMDAVAPSASGDATVNAVQARARSTECAGEAGLDAAIDQARIVKETEFVTSHRARLEAFRERLAAQPPLQ